MKKHLFVLASLGLALLVGCSGGEASDTGDSGIVKTPIDKNAGTAGATAGLPPEAQKGMPSKTGN